MELPEMTVEMLAERLGAVSSGTPGLRLRGVSHDSRRVRQGDLFVAMRGERFDGHDHVAEAVSRGAAAVVCERPVGQAVPQIVVPNGRIALARAAAEVYGHPSQAMRVVGVTGTNGKTTVVHMIESIVRSAGGRTGTIGTLGVGVAGEVTPTSLTTPEASDLQRQLAAMRSEGVDTAVMEVSSHGLACHRVDHLRFDLAVFTNLGHDHLDFHPTREAYYKSKERLFSPRLSSRAVVWTDTEWGRRLAAGCRIPVTTVGTGPDAEVSGKLVSQSLTNVVMTCRAGGTTFEVDTPMGGHHNGANALLAAAAALRMGYSIAEITTGIAQLTPVEGRFEVVASEPATVVVDYAHTPGAISAVIAATRAAVGGRIILVIGAGGGRDRTKRQEMAEAAAAADRIMLTSDNPRTEDPLAILADLAAGLSDHTFQADPDRRQAIHTAVGWAQPGDVVLILGKGHERYQEIEGVRHPSDDRQLAREAVRAAQRRRSEVAE